MNLLNISITSTQPATASLSEQVLHVSTLNQHSALDAISDGMQRDEKELIVALVEHSAWVGEVLRHLSLGQAAPAEDDGTPCSLKRWLDHAETDQRYDLRLIRHGRALHEQLHDLADSLIGLKQMATSGLLQMLSDQLVATRDVLVELLSDLLTSNSVARDALRAAPMV